MKMPSQDDILPKEIAPDSQNKKKSVHNKNLNLVLERLRNKGLIPKRITPSFVLGAIAVSLLAIGLIAALVMSQLSQDIRQQASSDLYNQGNEGKVCCTFNGGTSYSYADKSICQANGTQASDSSCSENQGASCENTPPSCDGNTAVQCVNGRESRNPCGGGYRCQGGVCIEDTEVGCQQAGCPYQWVCNNNSGQCEYAGQDGSCINVGCPYQQGYQCNT